MSPRGIGFPRLALQGAILFLALVAPLVVSVQLGAGASTAATTGDPVIATAGDISCDPANKNWNSGNGTSNACRQLATSNLIVNGNFAAVLPLGDNQYECGSLWAYQNSYDLSWGRFKSITRPSPGNHDYLTHGGADCTTANKGAAGYYNYFGTLAGTVAPGKGYYSYDVGTWHLISLNSNCSDAGGCGPTTPQGKWLAADLAAHANQCIIAYWHIPLFSSGGRASSNSQSFWNALYAAHADVILNGHDHIYERFAPQSPSGQADPTTGIREFIAGTGGNNHTSIANVAANSVVRDTTTFGVLELTLHPGSYDWQFVPDAGSGSFTDSGSSTCHNASTDHTPPSDPTALTATTRGASEIDLAWTASTDDTAVAGYRIYRDGVEVGTSPTNSYADTGLVPATTHSYQVSAYDSSGNQSGLSNTAVASTNPDTTPPTAPTNLTAAPGTTSGIDLSWGKSTDDSGIDHYVVVRDGAQIDTVSSGASATYTYSDTAVAPGTTHTYVVQAVDLAGNVSPDSNAAVATSPNTITATAVADTWVQDTTPTTNYGSRPTVGVDASPDVKHALLKFNLTGLLGRPVVSAKLRLYCADASSFGGEFHKVPNTSWDELAVNWNTAPAADPAVLGTLGSVQVGTWYEVDVTSAVTGDGLVSFEALSTSTNGADYSSREGTAGLAPQLVVTTTAGGGDTTPPSDPGNLSATGVSASEIDLSWTAASDDKGVDHYDILRGGVKVGIATGLGYQDTGLSANTAYDYVVQAVDSAGNHSTGAPASASTLPDGTPPSIPGGVTAAAIAANQIDVSWTASADNVGVDHYALERNGQPLVTVPGTATSYSDTSVLPSTQYSYTVEAFDAAGNHSGPSSPATATTPAPPTSLTFNPEADSYVSSSSPTSNYGSASSLRVDASPVINTYLRFTVQGVVGTVKNATLRLYATSNGNTGHQVSQVADNTWDERTITYGNAPAIGSSIGSSGAFSSGAYVDVDVTPYVTGNGTYSLAVRDLSSVAVSYGSRESANPPQLVLAMGQGSGGGSPPPQPSLDVSANDGNDYVNGSTVFYRATGSTSGSFTVTASADPSTTHVRFPAVFGSDAADDSTSPYSTSYSWGAGANVTGSFQVTAANSFGDSPPASFTVAKDVSAPTTTIACNGIPNCTGTYSGPVNISLSATDGAGSGPATIYYTTDGSTPTTNSTVYTSPFGVTAGATVSFFSVDNLGNAEAPKARVVTAGSGGSGIALVRQTTASATAASLTVTPSAASAAGDTLVATVAVKAGTSASVTSVTDSAGGTWTKGPSSATSGVEDRIEIWYRLGAPSVSSVTINLSASKSFAANVSEWSGIASVISLAGGTNVSSTTASTPVQANSGAPYVVIGAVNYPADVSSSLASGPFAGLSDFSVSTNVHGRAAYVITPTNGSFQAVWNLSGLSGGSAGVTIALGAA